MNGKSNRVSRSGKASGVAKATPRAIALPLADRVIELIESSRQKVVFAANLAQVYTYYEIGRQIVEEEQGGSKRAGYGDQVIADLASRLTARFGKGWGERSLRNIRKFYLEYSCDEIRQELIAKSEKKNLEIGSCQIQTATGLPLTPTFVLGWTHYLILMRIRDRLERYFYEMEAEGNHWSSTDLTRQISKRLFERAGVSKGKDKEQLLAYLHRKVKPIPAAEVLKDPYVLDFLGLPERVDYSESELETRIINHIQEFMLELGQGFLFAGRQVRFSFGEQHYRVDLVFYNRLLRCFFLIDLKIGKVKHKDIGQMEMYVHYYDRLVKTEDENPTIGILLCSDDNRAVVEMTLPECEKNQIFARQYSAIIPKKETLERIIREEQVAFESQALLKSVSTNSKSKSISKSSIAKPPMKGKMK